MNIFLVNPKPSTFEPAKLLPLGLGYIAGILEQEGYEVKVLDMNVSESSQQAVSEFKSKVKKSDLVGFSALTPAVKYVWKLCELAKKMNPNIITVIGGHHVSALSYESLEQSYVDIVVRGEGEYTMTELCDVLERGRELEKIKGISYKIGGKIRNNPPRPLIRKLDDLPLPAYHLFPMDKYTSPHPFFPVKAERSASIITSRGCPFACTFCSVRSMHGRGIRFVGVEKIIENLNFLNHHYKIEHVGIEDDCFNANPKRVVQLCESMREEGIDLSWDLPNGIRADLVNERTFQAMRQSGCVEVSFGAESGNQYVLDHIIHKQITLNQIEHAVRLAKKVGFRTRLFFILGMPSETAEQMENTINFAVKLNPDSVHFSIAGPYPGTELYEQVKDHLLITDWNLYGHFEGKAFFECGQPKKEVVEYFFKRAYRRFYFRPSYLFKKTFKPETYISFAAKIRALISLAF